MSVYNIISREDAKEFLRSREAGTALELEDMIKTEGSGDPLDFNVTALKEELAVLQRNRERGEKSGFEQVACEPVHKALKGIAPAILADAGFWIWLSLAEFADIVDWRFGHPERPTNQRNFGVGQLGEALFFRLWLRGAIGHDPTSADPYELSRLGDQDLWRSHIIRQSYGNATEIARALLRLQANRLGRPILGVDDVRALAKQLKRLHANVYFELMSSTQADALIVELSDGITRDGQGKSDSNQTTIQLDRARRRSRGKGRKSKRR